MRPKLTRVSPEQIEMLAVHCAMKLDWEAPEGLFDSYDLAEEVFAAVGLPRRPRPHADLLKVWDAVLKTSSEIGWALLSYTADEEP